MKNQGNYQSRYCTKAVSSWTNVSSITTSYNINSIFGSKTSRFFSQLVYRKGLGINIYYISFKEKIFEVIHSYFYQNYDKHHQKFSNILS